MPHKMRPGICELSADMKRLHAHWGMTMQPAFFVNNKKVKSREYIQGEIGKIKRLSCVSGHLPVKTKAFPDPLYHFFRQSQ